MMTETQEFLERLKNPLQFGIRKACFEFFNDHHNNPRIYDLRIQQVNELDYYHVLLIADSHNAHIGMLNDLVDILEEHTPSGTRVAYEAVRQIGTGRTGKFERVFYVYDRSLNGHGEQHFNLW